MIQPKTYEELCDLVETVNCDAAQYLRDVAPGLASFMSDPQLIRAFEWDESDQTHRYWWCIENKIELDTSYFTLAELKERAEPDEIPGLRYV